MLKADETSGNVLFEEIQKHPQWVSWVVRIGMGITILGLLIGFITEKGKTEMAISMAVVIPIAILVIYLNSNVQLEKIVTTNGLYFRERPWQKKYRVIEKEEIEFVTNRKFPFLSYGFGWVPGYGRYHNAGSREGLQLYLINGKRFYFSAADIDSFKRAMNSLINPDTKTRFSEF